MKIHMLKPMKSSLFDYCLINSRNMFKLYSEQFQYAFRYNAWAKVEYYRKSIFADLYF